MTVSPSLETPSRGVVAIGCGPHYFSKYHSVLEQGGHRLLLAIDMEAERSAVMANFALHQLQPERLAFLPERLRDTRSEASLSEILDDLIAQVPAEVALICTEPKAHRAYAAWAMNRGLDVFMDKPISAAALPARPGILFEDYEYLEEKSRFLGRHLTISCERRAHPGYAIIKEEISHAIQRHDIPVTSINVTFGGGKWLYPHDYMYLENHPFQYGYGVLFHSGYHYVDVVASIAEMNAPLVGLKMAQPEIQIMATRPGDIVRLASLPAHRCSSLNTTVAVDDHARWKNALRYGEVDLGFLGRYPSPHGHGLLFSGQLHETSVAARRVGTGRGGDDRVRSEQLLINLGHYCSISLFASSYRKLSTPSEPEDFDLVIARHPSYRGGGVVRFNRSDLSRIEPMLPLSAGVNGWARTNLLASFLAGETARSPILSHRSSMQLFSSLADKLSQDIEERASLTPVHQV